VIGNVNVDLVIGPVVPWPAPDKTDGPIRAEVEVIEPTGDELFAHVMVGPIRLDVAFAGRPALRVGETVYLRPQPGRIHLFDAVSGERLKDG
jgi:multiple sugar transport system ATP-binding protein